MGFRPNEVIHGSHLILFVWLEVLVFGLSVDNDSRKGTNCSCLLF